MQPYVGQTVGIFEQTNGTDYYENSPDNPGHYYTQLRDCINGADGNSCNTTKPPAFAWFAGDMVSGSSPCIKVNYDRFETLANSFLVPSLYVLGDNEWLDCHKTKTGDPRDPLVQKNYVKNRFYEKSGRSYLGVGHIDTMTAGPDFPELQMWSYNGIMFVGVTVVGSNNGLYDCSYPKACCASSLEIFDPKCVRATAEFREREATVNAFLVQAFDKAHRDGLKGVMVMTQGDMFGVLDCSEYFYITSGHISFYETLMNQVNSFNGKVVLINGDSHVFRLCNTSPANALKLPGYDHYVSNFISLQVPGSINVGWVEATIDPSSDDVFSFKNFYFPPPPYYDP